VGNRLIREAEIPIVSTRGGWSLDREDGAPIYTYTLFGVQVAYERSADVDGSTRELEGGW
jgi:hypothetical protein